MKRTMELIICISILLFSGCDDANLYEGGTLPLITVSIRQEVPTHLHSEYILLAKLINAESGHEPFIGMRAVGDVVMYIAKENNWSIKRTIYDRGRFDGINSRRFHKTPSESCYEAARLAILGRHILPAGILFFHNPKTSTDTKWVNYITKYKYKQIGNHLFCYHPKYFI